MRVPGRVGVCMRVRVCNLANPARKSYAPYCDVILAPLTQPNFAALSHKQHNLKKKIVTEHKMCVLTLPETFFILTRTWRDIVTKVKSNHVKYPLFSSDFNET
jgi:hypothetical protein